MIPRNEDMPAGSPMVYGCVECGQPMWVPEMWVAMPKRCPRCGGEWSGDVDDAGVLKPGETRS